MKIDIEGHEFRIVPTWFDKSIHKIKQLVIEFHTPGDIHLHPDYFKGLSDIHHNDLWDIMESLNKTHTLVHIHGNNACDIHTVQWVLIPNVFECTYIRNDYVKNKTLTTEKFPTALDYPNITLKPDLNLNGYPYTSIDKNDINREVFVKT